MTKPTHKHILDEALHFPATPMKVIGHKQAREIAYKAKRFTFSPEASFTAGLVFGSIPELILRNHQFAIPPYPHMYIEYNIHEFIKGINAGIGEENIIIEFPDIITGYLISAVDNSQHPDYRVWVCADSDEAGGNFTAFGLGFNPIMPVRDHKYTPHDVPGWNLLVYLLGRGVHYLTNEEHRQEILNHWDMWMQYDGIRNKEFHMQMQAASGEGRNLITLLLLLNMPKKITYTSVGASRGVYRGRNRAFAQHHVVHLDLTEPTKFARYVIPHKGHHATPILHDVKGHYYHTPGWARERCTRPEGHDWPTVPNNIDDSYKEDFIPRWTCKVCGSRRTWKAKHERGDPNKGIATSEYEV